VDLYTCPVLDLRAASADLEAFDACYRVEAVGMTARFARISLPASGGVLEQPARTFEAIGFLARIADEELRVELANRRRSNEAGIDG